jgi:hypothetical protein
VVDYVLLVRLDYGGLYSLLVFFRLAGKHFREALEEEIPSFRWLANSLDGFQFFHSLKARSAPFHSPPVDTLPFSVLIVVLWFRCCLLRPDNSAVTSVWHPRARVFFKLWAARDGHVPYLCRAGCPGVLIALGGCRVVSCGGACAARAISGGVSSDGRACFGCFFAFNRLYLTVCFRFDLV